MRPYYRKTANKKRSKGKHPVPLIGFAAEAERTLEDLAGDGEYLVPSSRLNPQRLPLSQSSLTLSPF